ncbi:hypothetical protein KFK09_003405 [Dendrobium nobile]|uniref:Pentatricopeptide repeat-containing protein n=1 Tax=Dendrobium nobile TaxID=94219 RepID=A0A8T3C324_DENNO|nr:hypothetical protein KFK09_003405 [Dendrobium nobile]
MPFHDFLNRISLKGVQHSYTMERKLVSSSLKSVIARNPIVSINLSILEERLWKCQKLKDFLQIHAQMTVSGFINDSFAASRLLSFCTGFHFLALDYSRQLLNQIENSNTFSWNTIMRAYVRRNVPQCCLPLYKLMLKCDLVPDNYSHPIVLQACSLRFCVVEGCSIPV